jgi:hypothetical protein
VAILLLAMLRMALDRLPSEAVGLRGLCPHTPEVFRFDEAEDRNAKILRGWFCFPFRRTSRYRLHLRAAALMLHFCRALPSAHRLNFNTTP